VPHFPPALLALADGTVFRGKGIGATGSSVGEVVFNTAMTGYQEILTDPSYARQIVTLTYPHIGNYGVNREDCEAAFIHTAGLVIRDLPLLASNFRSEHTLDAYLRAANVLGLADIDTRKLTRILREKGAQAGCLVSGNAAGERLDADAAVAQARAFPGLAGMDLAQVVSVKKPMHGPKASGDSVPALRARTRFASRSWPTISASSATSCACWRPAAAISPWCRPKPLLPRCWR
jgi:carbamoyl-phosphate synthase small subunit